MATPIRAAYFPADASFPAANLANIPSHLFNHIYYAFVQPHPGTFKLTITPNDQTQLPQFKDSLLNLNPPVKTLLSIGGADINKKAFSDMASTEQNRQAFIDSTIDVAREHKFDGLDLDWEFPESELQMSNLGLLYKQWRKALDQEANVTCKPRLLLTSAVYYAPVVDFEPEVRRSFPADAIRDYVDWVNPMCYDYYGSWSKVTGAPAALSSDPNGNNIYTKFGISSWIQAGVPANKLVMGMPLYGRSWTLQNPRNNGIGAPAKGVLGETIYSRIVVLNAQNNATVVYDEPTVSIYSYSGTNWTGYDDVRSVQAKVQYAKLQGLAGYFFWALGQDTADWTLSNRAYAAWN